MVQKRDLIDKKPIQYLEERIANLHPIGPLFDFTTIRSTLETLKTIHRHGVIGISFLHGNRSNLYLNPNKPLDQLYQRLLVYILDWYEDLLQRSSRRIRHHSYKPRSLHPSSDITNNLPYGFSLQYFINTPSQFHPSRTKVPADMEYHSRSQIVFDIDTIVDPFVDQLVREFTTQYGERSVELRFSGSGYHFILYIPTCSIQDSQPLVEGIVSNLIHHYKHLEIDPRTIDVSRLLSFPGTPYTKHPDPEKWSTIKIIERPEVIESTNSFLSPSIFHESWRTDQEYTTVNIHPRKPKHVEVMDVFECQEDYRSYLSVIEDFFIISLFGSMVRGYSISHGPVGLACYRLSERAGYINYYQKPSKGLWNLRRLIGQYMLYGIRHDQKLANTPPVSLGIHIEKLFRPLRFAFITIRTTDRRRIESLGKNWFWFSGHKQGQYIGHCWMEELFSLERFNQLSERIKLVPNLSVINWQNQNDLLPIPYTPGIGGSSFMRFLGRGKIIELAYKDNWSRNFHRFVNALNKDIPPPYETVASQFPEVPQEKKVGKRKTKREKSLKVTDDPSGSLARQIGTFNSIDEIPLLKEGLPRIGLRHQRVWECVKNLASLGHTRQQTLEIMKDRMRTLPNLSPLFQVDPQLFWADVEEVINIADDFRRRPLRKYLVEKNPIQWTIPSALKLLRLLNFNIKAVEGAMWLIEYVKRSPNRDINTVHTKQLRKMPGSQGIDPRTGKVFTPSSMLRYFSLRKVIRIVERGIPGFHSKRLTVLFEMENGALLPNNDPKSALPYLTLKELDKVSGISKRLREKIERQIRNK